MKLFGTDGIRGRAGTFLTAPLALQVGYWAGKGLQHQYGSGVVLIGQDSRTSGSMLATSLAAGLTAAGLDVWHVGLCPTPAVAYLTATLPEAIGGMMVSASHNPPADNGIKIFEATGSKLPDALQQQIEAQVLAATDFTPGTWGRCYDRADLVATYQQAVTQSVATDLQDLRIVLDLAWGAAARIAPAAFQQLGADIVALHDEPRGDRINVDCGSTHLAPLQEAVRNAGADLGFAFDGDADRVLAVDDRGNVVDGDYILYLWGSELMQTERLPEATIVTTVMANLGFERAWQRLGGRLVRTAVGDRYVHEAMVQSGAMLGGEQSGHVLCRHYAVSGDGLLTALHLAALVKRQASLSNLIQQSFTPYPQVLKNVRIECRETRSRWQECEPVRRAVEQAERELGDRGRVLVRPSGTEPLMRVMVEAESLDLVEHWTDRLTQAISTHLASA